MGAIDRDLKKKLASAVCTLLGAAHASSAKAAGNPEGWSVEAAVLHYQEADNRVSAVEPVINIRRGFSGNRALNLKFTLDVLTGATPNGATPTQTPQTFTRPSGAGSYTVSPGETPLDDTFHDTRTAVNASWQQPLGERTTLNVGVNGSKEYDFLSLGANATVARDFNHRNTTLSFGLATEMDSIDPVGGVPIPFAAMAAANTPQPKDGTSENKNVLDAVLGLTQVLDTKTVLQVNYSLSNSNGYLNDPYKILSVIDPATGNTVRNVYEERPDARSKHAIYTLIRRHLGRDVISGSYRYFFDDWGIKSHTFETDYAWKPSEKWFLQPNFRFYSQSEADFYRVQLLDGSPLPKEASADYRLAAFNGITLGLKYGLTLPNTNELILKFEYYTTKGDSSPSEAIGVQKGLDFYPDLKATMFQVQYRF